MLKLLHLILFAFFITSNIECKGLRRNAELFSFNTDVNSKITNKIQEEAVVLTLNKEKSIENELNQTHILFGFDIFNFVPQSFSVRVDYPNQELVLHLKSTLRSYELRFNLKQKQPIKSLFIRLGDEDDTVNIQTNCENSGSIVTPINLVKFFRSVAKHKFKILFNKHYSFNVYTEEDDIEEKLMKECDAGVKLTESGEYQFGLELDHIAAILVKFTTYLSDFLVESRKQSDIATEIFMRAFLTKDVIHRTSNMYSIIKLLQTLTSTFPSVFHLELQVLLDKIFWTEGREHRYVRVGKMLYFNNLLIKENLLNALFAKSPRTFLDSLRNVSEIGEEFRNIFLNPHISINKLMSNDTELKGIVTNILFKEPVGIDQMMRSNPPHIVKKMIAYYYLNDLNVNAVKLNNIHKRIIFNADKKDYMAIGKFIRFIFFKASGMTNARHFIESDLVIGMRIVYLLASGQIIGNQELYWTVRNLITKKDFELPTALEYPTHIIFHTLKLCYLNPIASRYLFMQTLENIVIYGLHNIGRILDYTQGLSLYNLYKDLILNDISKEKSILKEVLLNGSEHIHGFIALMIETVIADAGHDPVLSKIAYQFVADTIAFAGVNASSLRNQRDYIIVFRKILDKSSSISDKQKKINFKISVLGAYYTTKQSAVDVIQTALKDASLKLDQKTTDELIDVYERYNSRTDTLIRKIDEVLDEREIKAPSESPELEDIISQDLEEGVKFFSEYPQKDTKPLFVRSEDEDDLLEEERNKKLQELSIIEEWYSDTNSAQLSLPKDRVTKQDSTPHNENEPYDESIADILLTFPKQDESSQSADEESSPFDNDGENSNRNDDGASQLKIDLNNDNSQEKTGNSVETYLNDDNNSPDAANEMIQRESYVPHTTSNENSNGSNEDVTYIIKRSQKRPSKYSGKIENEYGAPNE